MNSESQPMFHKVRDIVRAQGVSGLVRRSITYAYQRVRPYLPNKPVRYGGIPICHDRKWGDRFVPITWFPDSRYADLPDYEVTLRQTLNETVRPGDSVVIVGAGLGVTAVVAALRAGPSGTIQCFEASKEYVRFAAQTAARNGITNINIHHAVVAKPVSVYGSGSDTGAVMPPSQLPTCNVLEMDCQGAEVDILREMIIQPRVIVVETHGLYEAPTELVASLLENRGYVVSDRGLAGRNDYCIKNDIRVLLGMIPSSSN